MYCSNNTIYIEDTDQCSTCEHYKKGIACPLMEALGQEIVYIYDDVTVQNCGFYKEFKRILKIVKD